MTIPSNPAAGRMPLRFIEEIQNSYDNDGLTVHAVASILRELGMVVIPVQSDKEGEAEIRRDERNRLAALLENNRETIEGFIGERSQAVGLLSFLLRLTP
jgi:hypothetical protein